MPNTLNAGGERIAATDPRPDVIAELIDVAEVSAIVHWSKRHTYQLSDAGKMPAPVRCGSLVRWRRREILAWIDAGCPAVRNVGRAGR